MSYALSQKKKICKQKFHTYTPLYLLWFLFRQFFSNYFNVYSLFRAFCDVKKFALKNAVFWSTSRTAVALVMWWCGSVRL